MHGFALQKTHFKQKILNIIKLKINFIYFCIIKRNIIMKKLPIICPSCEADLKVSSLSCTNCNTSITGDFDLPRLMRLSQEEQDFILEFVLSGGSLKAMAKQMNKSYPTVRNFLDQIIHNLQQTES